MSTTQSDVNNLLCGAFIYYLLSTGEVHTNTPIGLPAQCAYSFLWSIHILHAQCRGSKPPCAILFGNDLRVGLHIFVLSILKLQNARKKKS